MLSESKSLARNEPVASVRRRADVILAGPQ